jgi:hypothetical protein
MVVAHDGCDKSQSQVNGYAHESFDSSFDLV